MRRLCIPLTPARPPPLRASPYSSHPALICTARLRVRANTCLPPVSGARPAREHPPISFHPLPLSSRASATIPVPMLIKTLDQARGPRSTMHSRRGEEEEEEEQGTWTGEWVNADSGKGRTTSIKYDGDGGSGLRKGKIKKTHSEKLGLPMSSSYRGTRRQS